MEEKEYGGGDVERGVVQDFEEDIIFIVWILKWRNVLIGSLIINYKNYNKEVQKWSKKGWLKGDFHFIDYVD